MKIAKSLTLVLTTLLLIQSTQVLAERDVMFETPKPKLDVIDDAASHSDPTSLYISTPEELIKTINTSMKKIADMNATQDIKIQATLQITNHTTKELGESFVTTIVDMYQQDTSWVQVLSSTQTIDSNNIKYLTAYQPKDTTGRLIIIEFTIQDTNITDITYY